MKTLYLHVGTPKTATTAIQNFCHDNEEVLNKYSYCYPLFSYKYANIGPLRNAHFMVGRFCNESGDRDFIKENEVFTEGFEQIYKLFKQYNNIILSDEGIWNAGLRLDDERFWKLLKAEVDKQKFQIKIIVYIRRQDEFVYSWWNQQIKEGMLKSSIRSWEDTVRQLPIIHTHYYDCLNRISDYVGKQNIVVRIFDKKKFEGGSIYSDFVNAIGLNYTEEFKVVTEIKNVSFSKNACEIKKTLNALPNLDSKTNDFFRNALLEISKEDVEDRNYTMFSEDEAHDFMSGYENENALLAKEYLGTEEELFSKVSGNVKWDSNNPGMNRDIVTLFGTISINLIKENDALKKELREQKKQMNMLKQKLKHPLKTMKQKIFQ